MDITTDIKKTNVEAQQPVDFASVLATLNGLKHHLSSVVSQIKDIERVVKKQMKQHNRLIEKNEKKKKKTNPSGFGSPTVVSETLSLFMGLNEGEMVARTEVTKYIIDYIKKNNLQNPQNSQYIIPDSKLKTLFEENSEQLTYFNMQKHMNKHFGTNSLQ
jgi:chromatin remodeling complex protein RSC6